MTRNGLSMRNRRGYRVRGFTLLELMLVLAILALTSAVLAPRLIGGGAASLDADARVVIAGVRRAKAEALRSSAPADLYVDVKARALKAPGEPRPYRLSRGVQVGLVTARSQATGGGSGALRFYPDGSSTGGRVVLAAGDLVKVVDVDWLTGRVTVSEQPGPIEDALEFEAAT